MDGDSKESDIGSLLEVNRLDYRLPPSLAVANSRSMKSYPALNQSSNFGDKVTFVLSSGAAYLDLMNSMISFDVVFNDTNGAGTCKGARIPAHCGWLQAIQAYTIVHSSGVELDRQNDCVGEWTQIQNYYNRSQQKRRVQGSLYGLNDSTWPSGVLRNTTTSFSDAIGDDFYSPEIGSTALGAGYYTLSAEGPGSGLGTIPVEFYDDRRWRQKRDLANRTTLEAMGEVATDISGYKEDINLVAGGAAGGTRVHVVIPLAQIAGIFDVDLLAPSFLAAGLRIELQFYSREHFFQKVSIVTGVSPAQVYAAEPWTATQSVTIQNAKIQVESFTLTDSIVRKLSQISAQNGLEWYWDAIHQSSVSTGQKTASFQINRALSRANSVIVKSRSVSRIGAVVYDSYASDPWEVQGVAYDDTTALTVNNTAQDGTMTAFQIQLGAQYIPAAPVKYTEEYLHSALKTFNQFRRSDEVGGVPLWLFKGIDPIFHSLAGAVADPARAGLAIAALPLESSSTLQQSGSAISAQRTAVVNIEFKYARAADGSNMRRLDLFVPYSKLATLYLDSVVVRS